MGYILGYRFKNSLEKTHIYRIFVAESVDVGVRVPVLACFDLFSVERPKIPVAFFTRQETNKDEVLVFLTLFLRSLSIDSSRTCFRSPIR